MSAMNFTITAECWNQEIQITTDGINDFDLVTRNPGGEKTTTRLTGVEMVALGAALTKMAQEK